MSTLPNQSPSPHESQLDPTVSRSDIPFATYNLRYFERPGTGEKPFSFLRVMLILMSSHIGVRSQVKREEDFRRASSFRVVIAGIVYFVLIIDALILLADFIASG